MYARGLALPTQHIHPICVLTDAQRSLKQPEALALIQLQSEGNVLGPLCEAVAA